jgi:hypothetical protein
MKIFAVSDVHSFMLPMIMALNEKGFEPNNPKHLLVVCGDLFDRGPDTVKLIEYFRNLKNWVYVRGNHEDLMEDYLFRGREKTYDITNGTVRTANDILEAFANEVNPDDHLSPMKVVHNHLAPLFGRALNYFETKNYVFVHGWIPLAYRQDDPYAIYGDPTEYTDQWRDGDWGQARWTNGMRAAHKGKIIPDKTIVCGHWHCSYGHMIDSIKTDNWIEEFGESAIWEPYYADGVIAIDRCTAYTGKVNVVVLEDELLDKTEK